MITKDQMLESIRSLPDDATVRDAIERLEFIELIESRLAEAEANPGGGLTQAEVERRMAAWQPLPLATLRLTISRSFWQYDLRQEGATDAALRVPDHQYLREPMAR